ncbi:MAG: hypothetical protein HUU37_06855, partial [Bdellovibrionales bacterium]|nr:hypothetical protein [Bdellovibrionales bacterium]
MQFFRSTFRITSLALVLSSCSTVVRLPVNRFESPEAMGQPGAAKVELATQTTGDVTLTNDPVRTAPNVANPTIGAGRRVRLLGGYSVADIFDLEYQPPIGFRGRVQLLGAPFKSAKSGNFSLATSLGLLLSYNQEPDYLESGPKVLSLNETMIDFSVITGYRVADPLLVYGSIFWVNNS